MALTDDDVFAREFGVDVNAPTEFSMGTPADTERALALEEYGIDCYTARKLRDLQNTDANAYETELSSLKAKYEDDKRALAGRVSNEPCYTPGAKQQLDLQEQTPLDGAPHGDGAAKARATRRRGFLEISRGARLTTAQPRHAGVLKSGAMLTLSCRKFKRMAPKPHIDLSQTRSVADGVRFLNAAHNIRLSAANWRIIITHAVPKAVVNKLLGGAKRKDYHDILRRNIAENRDENSNLKFKKADIYCLDAAIIRALQLDPDDDAYAAAGARPSSTKDAEEPALAHSDGNANADDATPNGALAVAQDKPEQQRNKRHKNC